MSFWNRLAPLCLALGLTLLGASPLRAQQPIPPTQYSTDERGVDLTNGGYFPFVTEVVIGQPGSGGLAYGRSHIGTGWRDSLLGTINSSGPSSSATYTVSIGGYSDQFTRTGASGPFVPVIENGAALAYASGVYTYTTSSGVVATFSNALAGSTTPYLSNVALLSTVTSPNGEVLTYTYRTENICANAGCSSTTPYARLQSVTNNFGYQLKYEYQQNGTAFSTRAQWLLVQRVTGLNVGIDYCDPVANSCTFTTTWPSIQYATVNATTTTATDEMGRATTYRNDTTGRLTGVRLPGSSTDNVAIAYGADGYVDSVTGADGTWTYAFDDRAYMFVEVQGPEGQLFKAFSRFGMVETYWDADDNMTVVAGQPSYPYSITYPDGSADHFGYDDRLNLTEYRRSPATGSTLADIVTTWTYPATCANPVTCNQPSSMTDPRGFTTDYTYDATHGGVLTVTSPARLFGGDRPQTRIAYAPVYAWYKDATGTIVQAPSPVTLPVSTSACPAAAACVGGASEAVTTIAYGSTGVLNNLLPTSVTRRAGDSSVSSTTTSTWTVLGDVETVDGPLSGSGDTTRYRYNANRELTGVVGPDPDGGGSLAHRAIRITRDSYGQATLTEQGTTAGYTDPNWAAFTSLQQVATVYDYQGRPLRQSLSDGTTTYSLSQTSYDASGRPQCMAARMNPATFSSPPSSACDPATTGIYGPDRIATVQYDAFGRVIMRASGYPTTSAIVERLRYTMMGQLSELEDGEGNVTAWGYDGFGRPSAMYYPNASGGGFSMTDYESVSYDGGSLPVSQRLRDGSILSFTYDNLGSLAAIEGPTGQQNRYWSHDNLGRTLSATALVVNPQSLVWTYDALSRPTSEAGSLGTVAYQYDTASRLVRMTWPDTYYAAYDYDLTGAMTVVRENGATSGAGLLAVYGYDNLGRRSYVQRGNGVISWYGWNGGSQLTYLVHDLAGSAQDQTFTYSTNPVGQLSARNATNDLYAYTADPALADGYTNNGLNQVTSVNAAIVTYDGRGNLTQEHPMGQIRDFDVYNRLTTLNLTGTPIITLSYDPADRLSQITGGSHFLYSGDQIIAEFNNSSLVSRYVPGAIIDDYVAYTTGSTTIVRQWPMTDQLGSVIALTNGSAVATQINAYDEYGVPGTSNSGRFGFTGSVLISQSSDAPWSMRNRQYDAGLGRFLQTDPIGFTGEANLYGYVGNDPTNLVDPFGLQEKPPGPGACSGPTAPLGCTLGEGSGYGRVCFDGGVCIWWQYIDGESELPSRSVSRGRGIGYYFGPVPNTGGYCLGCNADFEILRDDIQYRNAWFAAPVAAPYAAIACVYACPVALAELAPSGSIIGRAGAGGRSLFGINSNGALRFGWGWRGSSQAGTNVIRFAGRWVRNATGRRHIDIWPWN